MKFHLFAFDEKSKLNNGTVRTINAILFVLVLAFGISNAHILRLPFWMIVAIPFLSSFVSYFAISTVVNNTTFCEWDYTERKKRNRFILGYAFMANIFSSMLIFSIAVAYVVIKKDCNLSCVIVFSVPVVFFVFNLLNIVSLYYPFFEKELTIGYKMQKKPENWKESGREINNDDEVEEIIRRDFEI